MSDDPRYQAAVNLLIEAALALDDVSGVVTGEPVSVDEVARIAGDAIRQRRATFAAATTNASRPEGDSQVTISDTPITARDRLLARFW